MTYKNNLLSARLMLILLFFMTGYTSKAQQIFSNYPKYELRAVWLTTLSGLDWPRRPTHLNTTAINRQKEEYAKKIGRCQSKTFLLIRKNDDRIIGAINVRWNLPENMKQFGGNIGYGIRPTERRKGYNKINLYLGLMEAQKLGLDQVMLSCEVSNLGSAKTMQALGGKLERTEVDPSDGILTSVYWFDVNETIRKYHDVFQDKICKK